MMGGQLPLKGQHVLITRGGEQGEKFCTDVASAGGIPYMVPLIDFRAHEDINASHYMTKFEQYDWVIFTSQNGVNYFFEHIRDQVSEHALRKSNVQYAVVGEKTRDALNRYQLPSRFMPNVYTAEDFARDFFELGLTAKKVLIPKGNLASTTIADSFHSRGILADEWIVYDTYYPTKKINKLIQLLSEDLLDVAAFTSPSTFNHFMKVIKQNHLHMHANKLMFTSIGTVTKRTIEREGYDVSVCPEKFTIDAMFAELCHYFSNSNNERKL